MARRRHIRIIATGGTIAGRGGSATSVEYTAAQLSADELVSMVSGLGDVADISCETLYALDSKDMGLKHWRALANLIRKRLSEKSIDGVVVTHGTDTLEETAWFLDLAGSWRKPVVIVGAMRASTALSADGPANLYQGVCVCAASTAAGRGVLVVMAGLVLSGWRAVKTSSEALTAFQVYPGGAVGQVIGNSVLFHQNSEAGPLSGRFADVVRSEQALPVIGIEYCAGSCGAVDSLRWPRGPGMGLVVAAFGSGGVPDALAESLSDYAASGASVVISSRVAGVLVMPETMTLIEKENVVAARYLNPQKAAALLSLILADGCSPQSTFEALYT